MDFIRCIKLARDGDRAATIAVVEALRPRITKMATYYARRCGEDPDDTVQEAWTAVLEAIAEVDVSIGAPEQYLIQSARWRVLDSIKRARVRRCERFSEVDFADTARDARESALAGVCVSEFRSILRAPQRAVLECLISGLTWREAGSVLGCTSANIAYWVRQIRRDYLQWAGERE